MTYFVVTFIFMLIVIGLMAVGVIFGRKAIKGSCGGANNGNCACEKKCDKRKKIDAEQMEQQDKVINIDLLQKSSQI